MSEIQASIKSVSGYTHFIYESVVGVYIYI
jgi:hypothetical protein